MFGVFYSCGLQFCWLCSIYHQPCDFLTPLLLSCITTTLFEILFIFAISNTGEGHHNELIVYSINVIFTQDSIRTAWSKQMEKQREVLVIYRLKFRSEHDFEKAVQTLSFGQNMGKYLESLLRSFSLQPSQPYYPMITPPEVNFCKDDLVIYVCSYEIRQYLKGSAAMDIVTKRTTESIPRFPYHYELFLKGTFGSVADLSVAAGESI
jgi:hypothetical protein